MSTTDTANLLNPAVIPAKWWPCSATALCLALAATLSPGSASALLRPTKDVQGELRLYHASQNANMCLNNPYQSITNGTQIVVNQNCVDSDVASEWLMSENQGPIELRNWSSGKKCMDNKFGNQSNGNPIVIWDCNGGPTQQWNWDGSTFHWAYNPQKCANVNWNSDRKGGTLVLSDCNGQGSQKFLPTSPGLDGPGGGGCENGFLGLHVKCPA